MKGFLILMFLSYANSDKLDLTYLPPPGSQYAGGRPEDIQTPLEYPKETYPTTTRQQTTAFGPEVTYPDDYKVTIGIDRGLPSPVQNNFAPQGQKEPLDNYPNSYKVPTTTISYAFTQTTTHPPSESYDTTINPITGRPISDSFNVVPQELGQVYQDSVNPIRPNAFGDQQAVNQFGGPQPTLTSTPGSFAEFPGSMIPPQSPYGQIYVEQNNPGQPQFQQDFQQSNQQSNPARIPGLASQMPFTQSQSSRNYSSVNSNVNQPGFALSTKMPQGIFSDSIPDVTYGGNVKNFQGTTSASPNTYQNNILNQRPNVFRPDSEVIDTQNQFPTANRGPQRQHSGYSGSDFRGSQETAGDDMSKPYQQLSTVSPTVSAPRLGNQQFPSGSLRPGSLRPDYKATPNQGNIASTIYSNRPERPQAEFDRNAVILNYTNVITPEGFAYSFDTSNGIHADESGTATDGVKAKGSYSYTGDDGKIYTVVYTADENGFQPYGDHLPTPPPIPEAIQRVIEKVKKEKEAGIVHDGYYDDNKYGDKMYSRRPVSRYPEGSNKLITNGTYVPYEEDYGFSGKDTTKQSQFKSGLQKPIASEFYNNDFIESQNGQVNEKVRKPDSGNSKLRPSDRISEQNSLPSDYAEADFRNKQSLLKATTERPSTDLDENQYTLDTLKEGNIRNQINNRRPTGNQAGHQYPIKQDIIKQTGAKENRFVNNDRLRRPIVQTQNENGRTPASNNKNSKHRDDNYDRGFIGRPLGGIEKDNVETNYESRQDGLRRPVNKFSMEHSTDHSIIDEDGFKRPISYNRNKNVSKDKVGNVRKNNNLPTKYLEEEEEKTELISTKDYGATSRPRLEGVNRPAIKKILKEQTSSSIRRPARPGLRVEENITKGNSGSIDDVSEAYDVDEEVNNSDDSYTTPVYQATDDGYEVSQEFKPSNSQKVNERPSTKYSGSHGIVQDPQTPYKPVDERFIDKITPKYGQKLINRPNNNPRTDLIENIPSIEQLSNNTGYMYIPPKNRLSYYDGNNLPTQSTSAALFPANRKPFYQTSNNRNEEVTIKPFMTLNVKRVDTKKSEENYDEDVTPNNEELPHKQHYDDRDRDVDVQYTTPDQIFSDETVSTTRPSMQPTVNADYPNSRIPQHYGQYSNKNTSVRPLKPSKETYFGNDSSNRTPFEMVPSTTPVSSPERPTYYKTTPQRVIIPGQQNVYNTEGNTVQKIPNNIVAYPTTPLLSEVQYNDQYYNENASVGPLQPSQATYIVKDSRNKTPFGGITSTTSLPSPKIPTYYKSTPQEVIIPGQQTVYNNKNVAYSTTPLPSEGQSFDRSHPDGQHPTTYSYRPVGPTGPSFEYTYGKLASQEPTVGPTVGPTAGPSVGPSLGPYDGPTTPQVGPNSNTESVKYGSRLPTTTYRPNYTTSGRENSFQKPGVQVDGLGRPVVKTDQRGYQQFVSGTEENVPVGNQNSRYNMQQNISGINKPVFDKNIDGQNYQPSTERIVGEDFRGPKQQQRFDPKLGYYY